MFGKTNFVTMNILEKIIEQKRLEVRRNKQLVPESFLYMSRDYNRNCFSLKGALEEHPTGIIAEFKRKSPSKGWIHKDAVVYPMVMDYEVVGVAGISILTDEQFFGGSLDDLTRGRELVTCPLLRKDFIIDDYQIVEAKSAGADVILLIAACLTKDQVKDFSLTAKELGLEVLLEIHSEDELGHICSAVDLVGVNNRDLKTFTVDLNRSIQLASKIPAGKILISESGLDTLEDIILLKKHGFSGFLIGEKFMKHKLPAMECSLLIDRLNGEYEN